MSFDYSPRVAPLVSRPGLFRNRALNRLVQNPNLLFRSALTRVKHLTVYAKKAEHFPPMLATAIIKPLACVMSESIGIDRTKH